MAINRKKIIADMSKVSVLCGSTGMIDAFGVLVNQLPTSFWNNFASKLTHSVSEDLYPAAKTLLVNAGHECGYHTGYGIITSEEWKAVVGPMIEKQPEDILYGAFAVFSAWGWAKCEVVELVPGKKMVVRAYDYYEADVVCHGRAKHMSAYMLQGVCGAFMDLAYGGPYDVTGKTGVHTFECEQTKGIEVGDDYGEFVVTPAAK